MMNWLHGQANGNSLYQRLLIVLLEEEIFSILGHATLPSFEDWGARFLRGKSTMTIHSQVLDYPGAFQSDNILAVKLLSTTELQSLHHSENPVFFYSLPGQ